MQAEALADITPNGTAKQLSTDESATAVGIFFLATGSTLRWGGSTVDSSHGQKLPTGVPVAVYAAQYGLERFHLSQVYVFGGSGSDAISITVVR